MGRKKITQEVLRRLYAHSGNQCAFPGCSSPIFEDDGTLTGECCHIEAYSDTGPRYNSELSMEERNGYDNLVFLCKRHHKIIDTHDDEFTVDVLKGMKATHESKFSAKTLEINDAMLKHLMIESEMFYKEINEIDENDDDGFKRVLDDCEPTEQMEYILGDFNMLRDNLIMLDDLSSELFGKIIEKLKSINIDVSKDKAFLYSLSSLLSRDFEPRQLAIPNYLNDLKMRTLHLYVKLLERLVVFDINYTKQLLEARNLLIEFQKKNYIRD